MPERENRLHLFLLPLAAFIAVVPLMLRGCSCGHDFDFHILSWFEAASQFARGNLHPHWAFTPAYNAGEPRFVFYPPISWTIGAMLGLVMPWTWTPIVYTWLALVSAGLALYYCARDFASPETALLAAAFYIVNPYTLFTAYERTAYGELLAAAWIPLLIHAILRERVTIPRVAIPVALLWLTDAPAAVMGCYALGLLTLVRLAVDQSTNTGTPPSRGFITARWAFAWRHSPSLQLALNTIAGTLLGLGLAAFYIVPAAWERRFVQIQMAVIDGMKIEDNFLFRRTADPDHDRVLLTASIVGVILIVIAAVAFLMANQNTKSNTSPDSSHAASERWKIPLIILAAVIILLLTPLSAPVWRHTPELHFLQFPWRLLAIFAAIMALAIALVLTPRKINPAPVAILILAAVLSAGNYAVFDQPCDESDTVQARLALFRSNRGSEPTDEYTPVTADNDSLAEDNPGWWLADDASTDAPANSTPSPAPTRLALNLPTEQTLILNLRDYPAWRITNNGRLVTKREPRDDGLIAVPLPAGKSSVTITYTRSFDQTLGDALTAISALLLLLTMRRRAFSF